MKTKPYWIVYASDYHEFDQALAHYNAAGLTNVSYKEIFVRYKYQAVFWTGKEPKKYIQECEQNVKE
jgi:hypothetical protein